MKALTKMTTTSEPVVVEKRIPFLLPVVKRALQEAGGDIPLAAARLQISAARLDEDVTMSKKLRKYFIKIRKAQNQAEVCEYRNLSLKTILENIEYKRSLYRLEALEVIREIAGMKLSENSAMMQVKLLAAVRLYNETGDHAVGGTINDTLQALNNEFHATAKRITSVRETVREVRFEENPRVIEAETLSSQSSD